jgi:hypothetical protein
MSYTKIPSQGTPAASNKDSFHLKVGWIYAAALQLTLPGAMGSRFGSSAITASMKPASSSSLGRQMPTEQRQKGIDQNCTCGRQQNTLSVLRHQQ